MKITISGSLGHIGKPLAKELLAQGHSLTIISSSAGRQKEIEEMGATAAIGSLQDEDFIAAAFKGADAVYTMVPPANYFDQTLNLLQYYAGVGHNYFNAVKNAGIQQVVNLSTIGGHLSKGNGILLGAHKVEELLNELPADISITHIRPVEFYYNLLPQIHYAKNAGFIGSNIAADAVNAWVAPQDIAEAIAEELTGKSEGRKVRYVASEEIAYSSLAKVLGNAIGNSNLKWHSFTNEEMISNLVSAGMNPSIAGGLTEMYAAINSGLLYEDYKLNKPAKMGKIKVADFAKEFAAAYNNL